MPVEAEEIGSSSVLLWQSSETDKILQAASDAYILVDAGGVIRRINTSTSLLFDCAEQDLVGQLLNSFVTLDAPVSGLVCGDRLWLSQPQLLASSVCLSFSALRDGGGWHGLLVLDNNEQRFREQLLRQRALLQLTLCSVTDAVISIDTRGVIETINPMARELLALQGQRGVGLPVDQFFVLADPVSRQLLASPVVAALGRDRSVQAASTALLMVAGRTPILIHVQAAPLRDNLNELAGCLLVFRDTTQARRESHKLNWQARHDALTSLPNRLAFETEVSQAVERASEDHLHHSLLYIDLYQFKVINDTCGHAGGDELLRQISALILGKLRSQDMLARLDSDEFGLLLKNTTLAGAHRLADVILRAVQAYQFLWDSRAIKVGISVGVVAIDAGSESEAQVMATASAACCTAKELGRNRIHLYNKGREVDLRRSEINWVAKINEALAQQRLCLYRQPLVGLTGVKEVDHYEVLIRMFDEQGQLVGPADFIPAAERYGLMDDIDRWVVAGVVQHLQQRQQQGLPRESYAVNLSGVSLGDPEFATYVVQSIAQAQIDASLLHFEVTETAAIRHLDSAVHFMKTLRALGSRFYLDDFGSGLSSFAYLKDLPVDFLKIDGSFVRVMLEDSASFAMVSTINHLAHVLGLKTVAEYVENDILLKELKSLGVDYAQGFGVGRPEPMPPISSGSHMLP